MEKLVGKVTHFYRRIGVAVLELDDGLSLGEQIHIEGHTTDFCQYIESLEVDHQQMQAVGAGADVALKVDERVRDGDKIYRIVERVAHF